MSDRFPGRIWIGGRISRSARLYPDDGDDNTTILQGLIAALNADGASHEYGDAEIPDNCTEAELLEGYIDGGVLCLKDESAVNGEFPETEQFCIEHGIPFDRNSDHYCEYDGENVYWRPGMNRPTVLLANSNGQEIVDGETVRKALTELIECKTQSERQRLLNAIRLLEDICPDLADSLSSFVIVE